MKTFWDKIAEYDRRLAELTEKAAKAKNKKEYDDLIDEHYELLEEKKSFQKNRQNAIRRGEK